MCMIHGKYPTHQSYPHTAIHDFLALANTLEEFKHYTISSSKTTHQTSVDSTLHPVIARTIEFYSQPELLQRQTNFSSTSLSQQLFNPNRHIKKNKNKSFYNSFDLLTPDIVLEENIMDIDDYTSPSKQNNPPTKMRGSLNYLKTYLFI
jgi:hypothetical protein